MAIANSHDLVAARELIVVGVFQETSCGIVDSTDEVAVPSTETSVCTQGSDEEPAFQYAV